MNQIKCKHCNAELALSSIDKEIVVFCDIDCYADELIDEHSDNPEKFHPTKKETLDGIGFEQYREEIEIDRALDAGFEPESRMKSHCKMHKRFSNKCDICTRISRWEKLSGKKWVVIK